MNSRVRLLVVAAVAAASIAFAAAIVWFPLRDDIRGIPGLAFWTVLALLASALPVRLPRGTIVSVATAPVVAAIPLGGPLAVGLVALIGSTDHRELRRQVPWYGTLFNHASISFAALSAGFLYELIIPAEPGALVSFLGLMAATLALFLINGALATAAVSARTGVPFRSVFASDISAVGPSWASLAPLGWIMAQVFALPGGLGWWATPLFVIPLFTTRMAYHRYVETRELFEQTIRALAMAVDARDPYTRHHSDRVRKISGAMARAMKLSEPVVEQIEWAGLLHDIGKIGIRDNILLKEGPLDKEERYLMNQHPRIGYDIVKPVAHLANEAPLIWAHHEWFNGSGYPEGKEALDIPLGARVMTIADAYEAMTSSRPYRKKPLPHEVAVGELEKFAGIQFDPEIVPVLVNLDRRILDRDPEEEEELEEILEEQKRGELPSLAPRTKRRSGRARRLTTRQSTAEASDEPETGKTRRRLASDDVS